MVSALCHIVHRSFSCQFLSKVKGFWQQQVCLHSSKNNIHKFMYLYITVFVMSSKMKLFVTRIKLLQIPFWYASLRKIYVTRYMVATSASSKLQNALLTFCSKNDILWSTKNVRSVMHSCKAATKKNPPMDKFNMYGY